MHAGGLIALVGREEESELLLGRWAMAKAGEGQVVLLSGEAGIGKSRLTAAFLERLAGEPHVRLRYFCSPQHTDSALHPIIGHMARAAGLDVAVHVDILQSFNKSLFGIVDHCCFDIVQYAHLQMRADPITERKGFAEMQAIAGPASA